MRPASDDHRDRAVAALARAYADGRLSLHELEARSTRVLGARSTLEVNVQLRGLLADEARRGLRRGVHLAGTVAVWLVLSLFLLVGFVGALVATHAAVWTIVFPLVWAVATALAVRDVRRT
jgi:uncharacterized protein DUF1707